MVDYVLQRKAKGKAESRAYELMESLDNRRLNSLKSRGIIKQKHVDQIIIMTNFIAHMKGWDSNEVDYNIFKWCIKFAKKKKTRDKWRKYQELYRNGEIYKMYKIYAKRNKLLVEI